MKRIKIIQTNKDLFSANFIVASVTSNERTILAEYSYNTTIKGEFTGVWTSPIFPKLMFGEKWKVFDNEFRPCAIMEFNNKQGNIVQVHQKTGLFSSYESIRMNYHGKMYNAYGFIPKDKPYSVNTIYDENDKVIGQIFKSKVVVDDMHKFICYIKGAENIVPIVLISLYIYSIAFYKHGQKVIRGTEKYFGSTNNKVLKEKYVTDFINSTDNLII